MSDALDTQAIEDTARQLLDARINAVRELAKAQVAVDHVRESLGEAEANHATVYTAATRAGWSDAELKQMGLRAPNRRTPGRPRRPRAGGVRASLTSASETPSTSASSDAASSANGS
jgi:hypothetical protein